MTTYNRRGEEMKTAAVIGRYESASPIKEKQKREKMFANIAQSLAV